MKSQDKISNYAICDLATALSSANAPERAWILFLFTSQVILTLINLGLIFFNSVSIFSLIGEDIQLFSPQGAFIGLFGYFIYMTIFDIEGLKIKVDTLGDMLYSSATTFASMIILSLAVLSIR